MSPSSSVEPKHCAACGRRMTYRARWARVWDEVRYCSRRCGSARPSPIDRALERALIALLAHRARHATVCPSEAARQVGAAEWRSLLERARWAARRLAARGVVEFRQGGRVVDPSTAKGPVRVGRGPTWGAP